MNWRKIILLGITTTPEVDIAQKNLIYRTSPIGDEDVYSPQPHAFNMNDESDRICHDTPSLIGLRVE